MQLGVFEAARGNDRELRPVAAPLTLEVKYPALLQVLECDRVVFTELEPRVDLQPVEQVRGHVEQRAVVPHRLQFLERLAQQHARRVRWEIPFDQRFVRVDVVALEHTNQEGMHVDAIPHVVADKRLDDGAVLVDALFFDGARQPVERDTLTIRVLASLLHTYRLSPTVLPGQTVRRNLLALRHDARHVLLAEHARANRLLSGHAVGDRQRHLVHALALRLTQGVHASDLADLTQREEVRHTHVFDRLARGLRSVRHSLAEDNEARVVVLREVFFLTELLRSTVRISRGVF